MEKNSFILGPYKCPDFEIDKEKYRILIPTVWQYYGKVRWEVYTLVDGDEKKVFSGILENKENGRFGKIAVQNDWGYLKVKIDD